MHVYVQTVLYLAVLHHTFLFTHPDFLFFVPPNLCDYCYLELRNLLDQLGTIIYLCFNIPANAWVRQSTNKFITINYELRCETGIGNKNNFVRLFFKSDAKIPLKAKSRAHLHVSNNHIYFLSLPLHNLLSLVFFTGLFFLMWFKKHPWNTQTTFSTS